MESCILQVRTANTRMSLYCFWHHLLVVLAGKTEIFTSKTFWKKKCDKSLQSLPIDHHANCCIANSCFGRVGTYFEGNYWKKRNLSWGIKTIFCWGVSLSVKDSLSKTIIFVNCALTQDIRSPNLLSSALQSRWKVKFIFNFSSS